MVYCVQCQRVVDLPQRVRYLFSARQYYEIGPSIAAEHVPSDKDATIETPTTIIRMIRPDCGSCVMNEAPPLMIQAVISTHANTVHLTRVCGDTCEFNKLCSSMTSALVQTATRHHRSTHSSSYPSPKAQMAGGGEGGAGCAT